MCTLSEAKTQCTYSNITTKLVIKYDETFSPYTAKISIIYIIILPKVLTHTLSAILINELAMKSLKKQSNIFLIACKSSMRITYLVMVLYQCQGNFGIVR